MMCTGRSGSHALLHRTFAAVLLLPPTLVGTIYGMDFEVLPELQWSISYPFALLLMVLSAIAPYYWFKHRGCL